MARKSVNNESGPTDDDMFAAIDKERMKGQKEESANRKIIKKNLGKSTADKKKLDEEYAKEREKLDKESANNSQSIIKAGWDGIADSSKQAVSTVSGHAQEVLGSGITEMYNLSKGMLGSLGGGVKKMWDIGKDKKEGKAGVKSEELLKDSVDTQKKMSGKMNMTEELLKESVDVQKKMYKKMGGNETKNMTKALMTADKKDKDDEKSSGYLGNMNAYFKRKEKADQRGGKDKKKDNDWGFLMIIAGGLLTALGTAIGAVTKSLLIPFQLLWSVLKSIGTAFKKIPGVAKLFKKIGEFFSKMVGWVKLLPTKSGFIGKVFKTIGKVFKWIGKIFKPVIDIFKQVMGFFKIAKDAGGLFGKFATGFARGFKILGWPLTIIMGVIDFISGFMDTEGNIIDKIKGGLIETVKGFIEMPVKLIGWISDWVLGLFGIEIEGGSGQAILNGIMKAVDVALDIIIWPFKKLWEGIESVITYFKTPTESGESPFDKVIRIASDFFSNVWQLIIDYTPIGLIIKGIESVITYFKTPIEGESTFDKVITVATDFFASVWKLIEDFTPLGWIIKGIKKLEEFLSTPGEDGESIFGKAIDFFQNIGKKVKEWWENSNVGKLVSKVTGFLGKDENLKSAKEAGIYDERGLGRDSTIDKEKIKQGIETGAVTKEMLDAILADKDLNEENTSWIKTMAEEATKKGSLFTHDVYTEKLLKKSLGIEEEGIDATVDATQSVFSQMMDWGKNILSPKGAEDSKPLTGDNSEKAMEWFTSKEGGGYTKEQASGLIGNLMAESNLDPTAFNSAGGGQGAQGIAQWRGSRLEDFEKFSGKSMKDANFEEQLKFITHEMSAQGKEKRAGEKLRGATSASEAAGKVDKFYERSGGEHLGRRQKYANQAYAMDTSKKPPTEEELKAEFASTQGAEWKAKEDEIYGSKRRSRDGGTMDQRWAVSELNDEKDEAYEKFKTDKLAKGSILDSVKKPGGKVEMAEADKAKAKEAVYLKNQEAESKRDQDRVEMTRVMKESSMKTDKYQAGMTKQTGQTNMIMAGGGGGGGGGQGDTDIPEEIDNYLLGLSVAGVLS
jgi:hypothetical protein